MSEERFGYNCYVSLPSTDVTKNRAKTFYNVKCDDDGDKIVPVGMVLVVWH